MRGITPMLAGAGWAATLSSFFVCMVYNVLISLSLVYMVQGGKQPWSEANYVRKDGCNTAALKSTTSAELFFYQDTVKLFNEKSCEPFEYGEATVYAWGLYIGVLITWILCFASVIKGAKSIQYITAVTVPVKWICLICLIVFFVGLNKSDGGSGIDYYIGNAKFPIGNLDDGTPVYYDAKLARPEIIQDAYLWTLYSVGLGVGIFFSYASYNHVK
jgi:SNF family Na+-dependent transporter